MTVYVCSAEECRLWMNFNFFPLLFGFGQKDVKEEQTPITDIIMTHWLKVLVAIWPLVKYSWILDLLIQIG